MCVYKSILLSFYFLLYFLFFVKGAAVNEENFNV